jgi:phage tail sheath protein FI
MAEVIISPGVFQQETDQSFYTANPRVIGAALVGPTVKGSPFIPTYVTSYNQFATLYGDIFKSGSYYYEYFTSQAAKEYFANGGSTMLVTRIISGSTNVSTYASSSVAASGSVTALTLESIAWGNLQNSTSTETSGALASGSLYNVRWEVAYSDTGSGLFTLLVRRGDDTTGQKNVLETWSNLSLDPQLPNYISRIIGDLKPVPDITTGTVTYQGNYANKSQFIRVASVPLVMVDSLDNNGNFKTAYTSSLPVLGSGSFGGGVADTTATKQMNETITTSNIQGFAQADYVNGFNMLTDKDGVQFNVLLAPGVGLDASTAANKMISVVENRGDSVTIIDAGIYGTSISTAVSNTSNYLSNYAATYYPWVSLYSQNLGKSIWCPPSTVIGGVLAFNDTTTAEWFAPAGLNRGGIPSVLNAERRVPQTDRDTLYIGRVNPIATFPGVGVCVWGQKTLQKKPSALDRLNVRRLLISLKQFIGGISRTLVFEQNTTATRNRFLAQVNPYLSSVVQRQGLYAYKVVMDATNNTADVVDRNQLVGQIYIQPTKTAEFVILNFNILPTGATFPA